MNIVGHRRWRQTLIDCYGSVEAFDDAQSVRIMLRFLHQKLTEELDFRKTLEEHPEELARWTEHSDPELADARTYVKELEDWLNARGLSL